MPYQINEIRNLTKDGGEAIVYAHKRETCDQLAEQLAGAGLEAASYHGGSTSPPHRLTASAPLHRVTSPSHHPPRHDRSLYITARMPASPAHQLTTLQLSSSTLSRGAQ
jgi:hypothetical protein